MIKVVLDTNILISNLFWEGNPRKIVNLAISNKIKSITSPEILEEVEAVLYEDFPGVSYSKIEKIIKDILSYSNVISGGTITVKGLRDMEDTKIIACAIKAKADYIITGDKDLLILEEYKGIKIVSPRIFLETSLVMMRRIRAENAVNSIQSDSIKRGKDKISIDEINTEISAVRKKRR